MSTNKPDSPENVKKKGFIEELLGDVFNIDRGLPGTIWTMLKSPYEVVNSYFTNSGKYVAPLRYCIIILAVTTFISVRFIDYEAMMRSAMEAGAGDDLDKMIEQLSTIAPNFDWAGYLQALNDVSVMILQKFTQLIYLILMAPIMAFFSKLFFKQKKPAFINHYVLMVYGLTTFSLITITLLPLTSQAGTPDGEWTILLSVPLMFGFLVWSMVSYLKLKGFAEILQAFIALMLGYFVYAIVSGFLLYTGAYIKVIL